VGRLEITSTDDNFTTSHDLLEQTWFCWTSSITRVLVDMDKSFRVIFNFIFMHTNYGQISDKFRDCMYPSSEWCNIIEVMLLLT